MNKSSSNSLTLTAYFVEELVRDGYSFIELTKTGDVYFWCYDTFILQPALSPPPCLRGTYSFLFGYVYELPKFE